MRKVSFADAELDSITFSNGCDLSSITLPRNGDYRRYNLWQTRLLAARVEIAGWPEPDRTEGLFFVDVQLNHAKTQDWMIVGAEELRRDYAPHACDRILALLDRHPGDSG
jgi:hypothetical protein